MLRFDYIPYPLWRRRLPDPLGRLVAPFFRLFYPVEAEQQPPATPRQMGRFMARWGLLGDMDEAEARRLMTEAPAAVEMTRGDIVPQAAPHRPVRLPAQWETMEAILLSWPVFYPPLWTLHAQLAEAITPVCEVHILVPRPTFASAIRLFLEQRGKARMDNVRFYYLPTDDIWIRDYGPFVGLDEHGQRVTVHAFYDTVQEYPQSLDNAMPERWAAHHEVPALELHLPLEGGNLWSDGVGTLIMADTFHRQTKLSEAEALDVLREAFLFEKLIVTPHLQEEKTGHVDLLVKPANEHTILVTEPGDSLNTDVLRQTADLFRGETNARGQRYQVIELPALPQYFNWGAFSIWRSYTNSLTVNGRVLVPVYGVKADEQALATYHEAMPEYEIIPIDCKIGINGGGAVHCMTKEVPAIRSNHKTEFSVRDV